MNAKILTPVPRLNHFKTVLAILVAFLGSLFFLDTAQANSASDKKGNKELSLNPPIVNLQAKAQIEVNQDTVQFVLFTQKDGKDEVKLAKEVNQAINSALNEAKQKINDDEIKVYTGAFSVTPRYNKEGEISTWQARAELVIESQFINEAAELAGQLNTQLSVARVSFSLSDAEKNKHIEDLTQTAIASFENRAQRMTESLGYDHYRLKELTIDSEAITYQPSSRGSGVVMMAAAESNQSLAVEAGQEAVDVTARGSIYLIDKTDTCQ